MRSMTRKFLIKVIMITVFLSVLSWMSSKSTGGLFGVAWAGTIPCPTGQVWDPVLGGCVDPCDGF